MKFLRYLYVLLIIFSISNSVFLLASLTQENKNDSINNESSEPILLWVPEGTNLQTAVDSVTQEGALCTKNGPSVDNFKSRVNSGDEIIQIYPVEDNQKSSKNKKKKSEKDPELGFVDSDEEEEYKKSKQKTLKGRIGQAASIFGSSVVVLGLNYALPGSESAIFAFKLTGPLYKAALGSIDSNWTLISSAAVACGVGYGIDYGLLPLVGIAPLGFAGMGTLYAMKVYKKLIKK